MPISKSGRPKHRTRIQKTYDMLTAIVQNDKRIRAIAKEVDKSLPVILVQPKTPKRTWARYNKQFLELTK